MRHERTLTWHDFVELRPFLLSHFLSLLLSRLFKPHYLLQTTLPLMTMVKQIFINDIHYALPTRTEDN